MLEYIIHIYPQTWIYYQIFTMLFCTFFIHSSFFVFVSRLVIPSSPGSCVSRRRQRHQREVRITSEGGSFQGNGDRMVFLIWVNEFSTSLFSVIGIMLTGNHPKMAARFRWNMIICPDFSWEYHGLHVIFHDDSLHQGLTKAVSSPTQESGVFDKITEFSIGYHSLYKIYIYI